MGSLFLIICVCGVCRPHKGSNRGDGKEAPPATAAAVAVVGAPALVPIHLKKLSADTAAADVAAIAAVAVAAAAAISAAAAHVSCNLAVATVAAAAATAAAICRGQRPKPLLYQQQQEHQQHAFVSLCVQSIRSRVS